MNLKQFSIWMYVELDERIDDAVRKTDCRSVTGAHSKSKYIRQAIYKALEKDLGKDFSGFEQMMGRK